MTDGVWELQLHLATAGAMGREAGDANEALGAGSARGTAAMGGRGGGRDDGPPYGGS